MTRHLRASMLSLIALAAATLMTLTACGPAPTIPADARVYLTDQREFVAAIDPKTGATAWQTPGLGSFTNVVATADTVYIGGYLDSTGFTAYAFDARDGHERWHTQLDPAPGPGSLTLADGALYFTSTGDTNHTADIYAVRPDSGALLWKQSMPGYIAADLRVVEGNIYVPLSPRERPAPTGTVLALRARDGAQLWSAPLPGDPYSIPVVVNGRVILSVDGGWVVALQEATGALAWRLQPPGYQVGLSSVDTADGLVFVAVSRTFYAMQPETGKTRWRVTVEGGPERSHQQYYPAVVHGTLYALAGNDTYMYALNPQTGETRWRYDHVGFAVSAPVVDRGIVYMPVTENASRQQAFGMVALGEADGSQIRRYDTNIYAMNIAIATA